MSVLRRLFEIFKRIFIILLAAQALVMHDAKVKAGLTMSLLCSSPVPLTRSHIVLLDSVPFIKSIS